MSQISERKDDVIVRINYFINELQSSSESKPIIFEVDGNLRRVSERDYEPAIIAIGPIHRGKDHLKGMEEHKVRYLQQVLQRKANLSVEKLVMKLREMEEKARRCYPKSVHLDKDEFVEMLLLDGCFVVELLRKYWLEHLRDKNDDIFKFDLLVSQIGRDLMLFENQLPLFVLNELFDMTKTEHPDDNIDSLVLLFVEDMFPWLDASKVDSNSDILLNADHLLALVHQSCFSISEAEGHKQNNWVYINPASELKEAGIQLKRSEGVTLLDVAFVDGVIELPPIDISDQTESILRNLIVYEMFLSSDHPKFVIDYAFFMHCLINSTKDVEILRRCGIITNSIGGDELICQMFNGLGKNVVRLSDFHYSDVFQSVNRHCRSRHKRWMAKLKRNYLNSPWAVVSLLAVATLLILTVLHTLYSVLSYRKS